MKSTYKNKQQKAKRKKTESPKLDKKVLGQRYSEYRKDPEHFGANG